MNSFSGGDSSEGSPNQSTTVQATAPTRNPPPPRTHTRATSTPNPKNSYPRLCNPIPTTQHHFNPFIIPPPQAHYIPSRPSSAGPSATTQSYSAQATSSTPPKEEDTIEFLPSPSAPLQESAPRRYPLPHRPALFKGCDQCWEMIHEPTAPVLYVMPVDDREGWVRRTGRECWGWVRRVGRRCWEWIKRCFLFRD